MSYIVKGTLGKPLLPLRDGVVTLISRDTPMGSVTESTSETIELRNEIVIRRIAYPLVSSYSSLSEADERFTLSPDAPAWDEAIAHVEQSIALKAIDRIRDVRCLLEWLGRLHLHRYRVHSKASGECAW